MSAHSFCACVRSSGLRGAKRVMSSARPTCDVAIRMAKPIAAGRYFIVSLPVVADFRRVDLHQSYADGAVLQWNIGRREAPVRTTAGLTRGEPSHYLWRADRRNRNWEESSRANDLNRAGHCRRFTRDTGP